MKYFLFIISNLMLFSTSGQSGITWEAPKTVANSSYGNQHPRIVLNGKGNPVILFGNSGQDKTYITRWNGTSFTMPMPANPNGVPVFAASWAGPDIASHGDTIYVVYKRSPETDTSNHIFIRRSTDGGQTFGIPVRVDNVGDSLSRFPVVATTEEGHPLVAFMKFDPSFGDARWVVAKSDNFGDSFNQDVLASKFSGGTVCDCCPGAITVSGDVVAMLYRDNLSDIRDTWIGISENKGETFEKGINADKHNWELNACPSTGPEGLIWKDSIYSVFMNAATGDGVVYINKNALDGSYQMPATPIISSSSNISGQNYPRIDGYGNKGAIVWKQINNGRSEIALVFSTNLANGFPTTHEVVATTNDNSLANADIAVENGEIHVVWEDMSSGTVRYRKGTFLATGVKAIEPPFYLKIYPNPTSDYIFIDQQEHKIKKAVIMDADGRIVLTVRLDKKDQVDIQSLANGVYFLRSADTYHPDAGYPFIIQR